MLGLVIGFKIDGKDNEGGRHIRGSDENLCFNEKEGDKF